MIKEERKAYSKAYYEANKEYQKAYYQSNKDKINALSKARYEANKDKKKALSKAYYEANKDKRKAYNKANKDKSKAYRKANKDKRNAQNKAYRKANKEKQNARDRERRKTDPLFKLKRNLRNRTYKALKSKGYKKESKTAKILGASYRIVSKHLERQFKDGMNWSNYGDWHVDHIIPLAYANEKNELINLCHFRNLQPLWAADNLSKGCRIE